MKTTQTFTRAAAWSLAITVIAGTARAQTKIEIREQCGRPTAEYTIQAGDHPGHMFRIEQSTCTPEPPLEIGGVAVKQHQVTGFIEIDAARGAGDDQWFHVFTLANGDSIYARSQGKATFEGARFKSSTAKWNFASGTGKFQTIKGSGSYACQPATGGWACEAQGVYELP
jgi:hypothetical protein